MADNESMRAAESMFDTMLHELEILDEKTMYICKPIREAQIELQEHLRERYPDVKWDFS